MTMKQIRVIYKNQNCDYWLVTGHLTDSYSLVTALVGNWWPSIFRKAIWTSGRLFSITMVFSIIMQHINDPCIAWDWFKNILLSWPPTVTTEFPREQFGHNFNLRGMTLNVIRYDVKKKNGKLRQKKLTMTMIMITLENVESCLKEENEWKNQA